MRETVALKATELPMLMRESRQLTMKEMKMELRGTSNPGLTFSGSAIARRRIHIILWPALT